MVCIALTPGYDVQLMSYLFGNILHGHPPGTCGSWPGLDLVVVAAAVLLNRQLLAVCFDQEFARMRGLAADLYYLLLLLGLTALTVVLSVHGGGHHPGHRPVNPARGHGLQLRPPPGAHHGPGHGADQPGASPGGAWP